MGEIKNFKMIITENDEEMGKKAAKIIADQIKKKPNCVIGLPTGSTPINMYKELIRMHKEEGLDFSKVVTFNLDEYYPIKKTDTQSYNYYMNFWFFKHVNVDPKNINIPNGEINEDAIEDFCLKYEETIKNLGGIDIQILGIGSYSGFSGHDELVGGHIGFNEAGSGPNTRTRKVKLSSKTRLDNSRFFKSLTDVPKYSITMGIGTIFGAKKIILLASGEHKADIMKAVIQGVVTEKIPASFLKLHDDFEIILDKSAASKLERVKKPWLYDAMGDTDWTDGQTIEKATIWLSKKVKTSIKNLTQEDFVKNGLRNLFVQMKGVDSITDLTNKRIENKIITENNCPKNKKILVISPHPDDDVICLGATMHFLNKFNELKILYATSGKKSVKDEDLFDYYKNEPDIIKLLEKKIDPHVEISKEDIEKIELMKKDLREGEAKKALKVLDIKPERAIFLDSPFYRKRLFIDDKIRKSEISDEDINGLITKLEILKPDIIIINGEHGDPHGTHGKTLQIFDAACLKLQLKSEVWYYKGAWEEYPISDINKMYCFDKYLMDLKIRAIKTHKSQISALYLGEDLRPFWKRALERNEITGKELKRLGIITRDLFTEAFITKE